VRIDDQGSNEGVQEMRVAVVGGTGLVGRYTVEALEREGHEVVVVARFRGVDVTTGAGPEPQDLVDMARRTLAARGESVRLVPSWRNGPFGVEMAGEVLLPGPGARLAPTTFDAWLAK
jgi:NAD(P)-dependent dehydrogenase (short-subunit alcohol dehydrogenase family)